MNQSYTTVITGRYKYYLNIEIHLVYIYTSKEKWNLKAANWELFTQLIELEIDILLNKWKETDSIEDEIQLFTNIIHQVALLTIKKSSFSGKKRPVPWWNEECKIAIKNKNKALNKFRKTKQLNDLITLKIERAKTKYIIKENKKKSWKEYTSTITSAENPTVIWNKIRSIKGTQKSSQIKALKLNDQMVTDDFEISNILGKQFYDVSNNLNPEFKNYKLNEENNMIIFTENQNEDTQKVNEEITLQELLLCIHLTKKKQQLWL